MTETKVKLQDFDFDSINEKEDSVGFDWREGFYVLKGFRLDTKNYQRIIVEIPYVLAKAVLDEYIYRDSD